MYKKLLILIGGAVLSLNASAGYIRYDFNSENSPVSGYFYQRDTDQSIADYHIQINDPGNVHIDFQPYYSESNVTSATIVNDRVGPTNFVLDDGLTEQYWDHLDLHFYRSPDGSYAAAALVIRSPQLSDPLYWGHPFSGYVFGSVTASSVSPETAEAIDEMMPSGFVHQIVPKHVYVVPEPDSLALLAAGALASIGLARRRKPV